MEKRSLIKRLLAWVLCITMAIQSFGIMPSVSAEEAKEEEAYEVLTFSDFGIDDGTYTEQQNGSAELESMDHAAFIGKVTFLSDDQHIRLMSIKDEEDKALADISVQENQLKVTDLVTEEATDLGEIELGQEYELQITFDCEDENVVMCYYLDGEEKGTHTSENTAENMEPKIVIDPKEDGVVVASYEEETQEQETEAAQEAEPISEPEVLSVEGESETSDYTELTFSDFGLEDKEYTSTGAYNELFKTTKVTSLDHVAISGKVQFTAQKGELRIGTSSADNQKSVATVGCWTKNLNGKDFINAPGTEYELSAKWNDEVEVRITFDYVNGNDVKVVYYINGTSVGEYTSSGVADKLQPAIRILSTGGSNPIGVKLTSTKNGSGTTEPDPSETAVYKTLTFSDWDITEGIYQTGKTYSLKDTAITSLHGYAFEGIVNFNGANNGNNNIKIAGTSQDPHHAVQICSENGLQIHNWRSDGGTDEVATYQPENWDNTKEMTLRVTFYEKSEDQWILHVFINDNEVGKLELKDTKFGTSLYFNGTQIQVRDANTSAADESKYKQYTFKHFGLYDGVYEEPKKATADITGMDGITFSGKITFLEDKQQIRLISTDEGGEVSIASVEVYNKVLQVTDWTSDNQTKLGTIEIGKEIDVKITFHYVDNDVVIRYYIDGELKASQVAKDVTDKIQPILLIKASGKGIQIASDPTADPDYQLPALTPEPEEYKTLTFSDWDIVYGIYQPGKAYALKDTTIKSLHGYAFEGIVNFNGCDNGDNNIKIGGADNPNVALQLWSEKGLKLHNHFNSANGTFVWNKLDNKKEMTIRLEFYERLTDNWIIYLYVNGEKIGKMELTDTKLGTSLYFNGTKIKVRDTGTKEEDDSSYKKITFKHFGLPDGTYQGVKLGTANLKSMDQVAVVGKVKFLMDKQEIRLLSTNDTGYLSIASVGIWNKELQVTDWTSNNQTKLGTIKVGQEVDLRITFKYVGQDVVIKYYIDGELRAAHVAKNVVSKLQMTLLVIPKGKGLDLISDPVVGAGINLPELPGKVIITEEDFKQSTPEELGYKEITLSSFGLEDDVSYGKLKKAEHTTASYVRPSLNNTYLNVDVKFSAGDAANSIRYASENGFHGLMIYPEEDGIKFANAEYFSGLYFTTEEMGIDKVTDRFNLKLAVKMGDFSTVDGVKQCDEMTVCIWINDQLIAKNVIYTDMVKAGNKIGFNTNGEKGGHIDLWTPAGAYTGIDFSIWGYTRKWKEEMGL